MSDEATSANQPGNYVVLGESTDTVIDGIRHRLVYCATPQPPQVERPDAAKDRRMWLIKEAAAVVGLAFVREDTVEEKAARTLLVAQSFADWVEEA